MSVQLLVKDRWEGRKGGKENETKERYKKGKGPGREMISGRKFRNRQRSVPGGERSRRWVGRARGNPGQENGDRKPGKRLMASETSAHIQGRKSAAKGGYGEKAGRLASGQVPASSHGSGAET
jgi:hypothetical protein